MPTFYLNVDSTGVDKLLMGPGIYWSYQTGSTEGPGGTYTLTPVFDTTLITLPSDVQVWYSNDGTNFAYSPAWITSRTGDTITVTVASSTTVTAKLYYASGTVVTDENGAEVASVSTVIGGVATTIGTVTVAGSTTPTEGVAEAYSATISGNATDQTYLWTTTDVGATIATPTASSTNITFSTSGPFNVTCTVSSATASDSPQADTLGVTVAAAGPDWDTYADGVYENLADTTSPYTLTTVTASGAYSETGAFRYAGTGGIQLYGSGGTGAPADLPPFVALWFSEDGANWYWSVLAWNSATGTANRYAPVTGGTMPTVNSATPHAIVYLTQDPTAGSNDTSTWTPYA